MRFLRMRYLIIKVPWRLSAIVTQEHYEGPAKMTLPPSRVNTTHSFS